MRSLSLYARLAASGIRKNREIYYPYILTGALMSGMFYIIIYLMDSELVRTMTGGSTLAALLGFGSVIVGFFSCIIMLYTNKFVMRRRHRELALYNVLGLEKKHIAAALALEGLFLYLIIMALGISSGILFSKLVLLVLVALTRLEVPLGFTVDRAGILAALIMFAAVFALILAANLLKVRANDPSELLKSDQVGEKEPKTQWALAAAGFLSMGAGYLTAQLVQSPLQAVSVFFIAVMLVIIGTECLFTAGSVAILKALKANKRFYYQAEHFTAVSGMIYRMRQNGVGLANICILCTMVLVTVSTTAALYTGSNRLIAGASPADITAQLRNADREELAANRDDYLAAARKLAAVQGVKISGSNSFTYLPFNGRLAEGRLYIAGLDEDGAAADLTGAFLTEEDYRKATGKELALAAGEAAVYADQAKVPSKLTIAGREYRTVRLGTLDLLRQYPSRFVVVLPSPADYDYYAALEQAKQGRAGDWMDVYIDLGGTSGQQDTFYQALSAQIEQREYIAVISSRNSVRADFYSFYGGFLFLGLFLGALFLIVTSLIIYYKQLTEGYQDRRRFQIMEQVGMGQEEARKTIRTQILMVFFLPLAAAGIHVGGAFHLIYLMLGGLGLGDARAFALCTLATLAGFAAIYAFVYWSTARTYYRIVGRREEKALE